MEYQVACKRYGSFMLMALLIFIISSEVNGQGAAPVNGYGKATYNVATAGKYMRSWLIAGPFHVTTDSFDADESAQQQAFNADFTSNLHSVPGQPLPSFNSTAKHINWQSVSQKDDIINLDSIYRSKDFVYAYALAEIKTDKPVSVMLGVGSDDGIKIWHNGKLVHNNWIPRAVAKDDDLVPLSLEKGSNILLMRIQDIKGGWAFTARLLDKSALSDQLTNATSTGAMEKLKMLIEHGADINKADKKGMTALSIARVNGRKEIVQLLLQNGAIDKPEPPGQAIVDQYYTALKGKESPGIAVLVANNGDVIYKKGFGYADLKNKVVVTPDTKFRIGSVTKQFTAAAILKLQEDGLLSVSDKLSKYIPDFPRGDEVTIHHLLTHTSGIHSYTNKTEFIDKVTTSITPDSLIAFFKDDPYDFNPGERYQYNNSGYFLLGYIISKVSGKPYDTFLKVSFFKPLQMNNTGVHYAGIKLDTEAKGYEGGDNNKYKQALNWDMSWAGGAGAIYSTLDDLLKWNRAFHGGKVLSEKSYKSAITPVVLNNGQEATPKYGYGLAMYKNRGLNVIGHSGGLHGFVTQLVFYPDEKLTVVMFSNTSSPEVNFNPGKIAEAFLWNKMSDQVSYVESKIKPDNLEQYTGRFDMPNIAVIEVTTTGGKLYAQLSGQPKFEIFPGAEDEFFWKVVEARIKFFKNDEGLVDHAVLYQNGQDLKAAKLPDLKVVEMSKEVFANYAGKYRMNKDMVIEVYTEGNKFFAKPTNEPKLEMLAMSDTEFLIKDINARLNFVKGDDGKATKFVLTMNGTNTDVQRIE